MIRPFAPAFMLVCALVASAAVQAQPAGSLGENFLYRVRSGDTLIALASTYTGNESNWSVLQTLNRVDDPQRLPIALELRIPLAMIPVQAAGAEVVHVSGSATADGQALRVGMQIVEGSTIRTASGSFVTLKLSDGSQVTIPENGTVAANRLRQFQRVPLTDSIFQVQQGELESRVAPDGQGVGRFEIRTPVAVTGVRGTRFRVKSSPQGASSEVLEGSVRLQPHAPDAAPATPVAVSSGYGANVGSDGAFSGVQALLPAPQLQAPARAASGGWTVPFAPVSGASAYIVRVSRDAEGMHVVTSDRFDTNDVRFRAPGAGTYYVAVRAVDASGLNGREAVQPFEGANVLSTPYGLSVATGTGDLVLLSEF
ncbi:FecR domain-containing protein [Bordetella bronchiseptica]